MEYIELTQENLASEHICCALSNRADLQVTSKKAWLADRLEEGLVFRKADARGKCFIEYLPAEHAWVPIEAPDCMHIDCLWVSGQLSKHGYADELLESCIDDSISEGKQGITIVSSRKKMPYLSDPGYLVHKGFAVVDEADPYFTLMYLPLHEKGQTDKPRFKNHVKHPKIDENGFVLYYTHGCPFTAKYVDRVACTAKKAGLPFRSILIADHAAALAAPTAWTNYALFHNGEFITHEILSEKKFLAIAHDVAQKH
jgi:hypothetical protein